MTGVRRIGLWVMGTVTAVGLVVGFDGAVIGRSTTETVVAAPAQAGSGASAGSTDSGSTGSGSTASGSTGSGSTGASQSVTGSAVQTRWGPVQVRITVEDGRITAVDVLQQPDGNPRDRQINAAALPVLVSDTLDAQSADVDVVSGATITSEGYVESLQSALDQAGL